MGVINQLKSLDLSKVSTEDVRKIISAESSKCICMTVSGNLFIERLRLGTDFVDRMDVSYKPGKTTDDWNRATVPGRSIFYGTISHPSEDVTNRRLIAICESSSLYRQGIDAEGEELYTLSRWLPIRELKVGVIVGNSVFENKQNIFLGEAQTFLNEHSEDFVSDTDMSCAAH